MNTKNTSIYCGCVSQALLCMDTLLSQQCAEPQLLLAALEFLSSLGKIFIPPENQVVKPGPNLNKLISHLFVLHSCRYSITIFLLLFDWIAALDIFDLASFMIESTWFISILICSCGEDYSYF